MISDEKNNSSAHEKFPVVALCGSAGGLEALKEFFEIMPFGTGMAFIVIQHLLPTAESVLSDLLQTHTTINVQRITDNIVLQPDHVYVLTSGVEVQVWNGHLELSAIEQHTGWPKTIDRLLQSLANDVGERAVAVILSGAGNDGTEGARAIRTNGGLVIVHDPTTAAQSSMPLSVLEKDLADAVLAPGQIPEFLINHFKINVAVPPPPESLSEKNLKQIVKRVRRQTGRDFDDYKISTMQRQIMRRMMTHGITTPEAYLEHIDHHPEEADYLAQYLLINVTEFFRDPEAFEVLKSGALLPLLKTLDHDGAFRIWVPGCASGEEAISIAILIYECLHELDMLTMEVRIFASDANHALIQQARTGYYPAERVQNVSPARLEKHFVKENSGYRVRQHISRMLIWSEHNLVEHPPFSNLHMISCRNVLIYFQRRLQDRVIALFQFALRPQGILFLGSSEALPLTDGFTTIDSRHKIYQRERGQPRAWLRLDKPFFMRLPDHMEEPVSSQKPPRRGDEHHMLELIKAMLVEYYHSTCMIVDEHYQLQYSYGEIDRYLRFIPGVNVQRNVLELAREGLDIELTIALHAAFEKDETSVRQGVWVRSNGSERIINLAIKPIKDSQLGNRLRLIIFDLVKEGTDLRKNALDTVEDADGEANALIQQLRQELQQTQEILQNTTQALQSKSEELTSSIEELQSANEEVQTTNEELRTSKEELESMNEELNTLNAQLIDQNEALMTANNTLYNFMQSTEIAMLFLDRDLAIRQYTPITRSLFNLRAGDQGRPLAEITMQLDYPELLRDAESVLDTLVSVEKEIRTTTGRWYDIHIRPYRTTNNTIDGLVLTFADITAQKEMMAALQVSEAHFRAFVKASSDAVYRMNHDWTEMRELQGREFLPDTDSPSQAWLDKYILPEDQPQVMRAIEQSVQTKSNFELEHRVRRVDGSIGWALSRAVPLLDENGKIAEWFGAASDITKRKQAEIYQHHLIDTIENSLLELDSDLRVINANTSFYRKFQVNEAETLNHLIFDLGNGQWDIPELRKLFNEIIPRNGKVHDYVVQHDFPDLGIRTMRLNARQIDSHDRILLVITDVSQAGNG